MIKALIAGLVVMASAVLTLPLLASSGGSVGPIGRYACGPVAVILDTIRTVESGGDYQVTITTSSASGAYAFIDRSWQHYAELVGVDTALYPRAYMAPNADQDAAAVAYVNEILADHDGDIAIIPLAWYLPSAIGNPDKMDVVPAIGGNVLTPREYQTRWLAVYDTKLAAHDNAATSPGGTCLAAAAAAAGGAGPVSADGRWALPAPRGVVAAGTVDDPHHDYPAWDLLIPTGTPLYAITAGTVVSTQHWNGNWSAAGCNQRGGPAGCNTCGNGITIGTDDGLRHTYCHSQQLYVTNGDTVAAGQHIADSGNTGRSGTPHLHLELRINGRQHCPQPLLAALYHGTPIPAPGNLPTSGCTFSTQGSPP